MSSAKRCHLAAICKADIASASRAALTAVGVMYDDGAPCLEEEMPSHRGSNEYTKEKEFIAKRKRHSML